MSTLNENRIDQVIAPAAVTAINGYTASIIEALPLGGAVTLSPEDHAEMLSMDVDNRLQASKVLVVMNGQAGAYVPPFITAAALEKDITLFDQLAGIEELLDDVLTRVRDLKRLAAHEAVMASNTVYGIIQIAAKAGMPGAAAAYASLAERFANNGGGNSGGGQPNP